MPRLWTPQDLPTEFKLGWYHFPDASTVTLDANGRIASIENKFDNGSRPCGTADATKRHLVQKYNGFDTAFSDSTNYGGILMTNTAGLPVGNADLCMIFIQAPQDGVVGGYRGGNSFWIDNPFPDYRLRTDKGDFTGTGSTNNSSLHTLIVNRKSGSTTLRVDGTVRGTHTPSGGYNTTLGTFGIKGADANYYVQKGSSLGAIVGATALSQDDMWRVEKWYSTFTGQPVPSDNPYAGGLPSLGGGPTLSAGGGVIVLTARTANLLFGHTLPAGPGAMLLTGQSVRPLAARRLTAEPVSFVIASAGVGLVRTRVLLMGGASFTLTARPANLLHGYTLPAAGGSLSCTGQPARLRTGRRLIADAATYTVAGRAAELRQVGKLSIGAERAQFTLTGQAMRLAASRRLVAQSGSLQLLGQPGTIRLARRLPASPGVFAVALQPAMMILGTASAPIVIPTARRVNLTTTGSRRLTLSSLGTRRLTI